MTQTRNELSGRLPGAGFSGVTALVIGDLMLDRYVIGEAHRISPEAPVPVVSVSHEKQSPGGAGNVALNLAGLRVQTIVAGCIGLDNAGECLLSQLDQHHVSAAGVLQHESRPTTVKTRVLCGNQQLLRFDHEITTDLKPDLSTALVDRVCGIIDGGVDIVILSDYAKGVFSAALLGSVIAHCHLRKVPVLVDPKRANYDVYVTATCVTPNEREFKEALAEMRIGGETMADAGQQLRQRLRSPMLLVTQGREGMMLFTPNDVTHYPAQAEEVYDVSGAGDTVIATFAAGLAGGLRPTEAAELATIAAGIVVRRVGTSPIRWEDLSANEPAETKQASGTVATA